MVPQYESPVRILGKEAVIRQQSVERDDLGQEAKRARRCFYPEDRPAPRFPQWQFSTGARQALIR